MHMKINKLPLMLNFKKAWQNLSEQKQAEVIDYLEQKIYSDNQCSKYAHKLYNQMVEIIWPYVDVNALQEFQHSIDALKMFYRAQKKYGVNERKLTSKNFFAMVEGTHSHKPRSIEKQLAYFNKLKDQFDNMLDKNVPYLDFSVAMSATSLVVDCFNYIIVEQQKQNFYQKVLSFINKNLKTKREEVAL